MSRLVESIERLIAEAGLRPGQRLPPERQLALDLGVSRPRLREAIQHLASRGLLRSRQGGGTFVAEPPVDPAVERAFRALPETMRHEAGSWTDVMEIRRSLDGDAAFWAAQRVDAAGRDRLGQALEQALASGEPETRARADASLHMAIAEVAQNVVLRQVMAGLQGVLESSIRDSLSRLYDWPDATRELDAQHCAIVDAIRAGRAAEARTAARAHLDHVADCLRALEERAARQRRASTALAQIRKEEPAS